MTVPHNFAGAVRAPGSAFIAAIVIQASMPTGAAATA